MMIGPSIRRVGAAVVMFSTALLVLGADPPVAAGIRPWLTTLDRCAIASLVIAAILQSFIPKPKLVSLVIVTAIAIAAYAAVGRPGRLEGVGTIAVALVGPLLLALIVRLSADSKSQARLTVAVLALAVVEEVRAVIYEPFADIGCPGLCRHNPVLVMSNLRLAHNLGVVSAACTAMVAAVATRGALRSLRSTRRNRSLARTAQFCTAGAATVLGLDAAIRLASNSVAVPSDATATVLAVSFLASVLVSGALVLTALDPLRARRDIGKVAHLLSRTEELSDIEAIFRTGFGDPALRVGYWSDDAGYLDKHGGVLNLEPLLSRTELTSHGLPIAVIVHSHGAVSPDLISRQLGSQSRLAIHNESLTVELNRSIKEVESSRRRIVEVSDAERRRLERDLHDGAQQRLLALSFELRRGERAAVAAHDPRSAAGFSIANTLAQTALDQLRHLAHGIHPTILNGAGLHDALLELATTSGRSLNLAIDINDPIPASVEATTYEILAATIFDGPPANVLAVSAGRDGEQITLRIEGVSKLPQHAIDRAEAAGGGSKRTARGFEVRLPCAW